MKNVHNFHKANLAKQLPFMQYDRKTDTLDHWEPSRTGDYTEDCELGRGYARELTEHTRASGNANLLGSIVKRIGEKATWGGVETGFFSTLAIATVCERVAS